MWQRRGRGSVSGGAALPKPIGWGTPLAPIGRLLDPIDEATPLPMEYDNMKQFGSAVHGYALNQGKQVSV
jgi:hypothetical protein